jgi:orotate phosphoribosyltransferase
MLTIIPTYMDDVFQPDMTDFINNAEQALRSVRYDTLVGTGLSASLVIPLLARSLGKEWLIIRKDNDGSHDFRRAAGTLDQRWVFVDDFISTGETFHRVNRMVETIANSSNHQTELVGAYLYHTGGRFFPPSDIHPYSF